MGDPRVTKIWVGRLAGVLVVACCALRFTGSVDANKSSLPRLPGGALLMGQLPDNLAVTAGDKTTEIDGGGEWELIPSLSRDGRVVASARMLPNKSLESKPTFVVGTFDLVQNKWTDYWGLQIKGGTIAISPDGSKVACSNMAEGPALLHVLDLKTGKVVVGPEVTKYDRSLSWSPDSRRVAFVKKVEGETDDSPKTLIPEIYLFDVGDGSVTKVAEGVAPSWSPSGEWIAFSDYSVFLHGKYADTVHRVSLVHPDGTGLKVVAELRKGEDLFLPAVWGPDSKEFFIERPQEDEVNPKVDVYVLDLATGNMSVKFRKTPEIYGWAASR
jgi:hypothetical protein